MMIFLLLLFSASIYAMEDLKPLGYRLNEIKNVSSSTGKWLMNPSEEESITKECHKSFIMINNVLGNCYVKAKYVFLVYSNDVVLNQAKVFKPDTKKSIDVVNLDDKDTQNKLVSAEEKAIFLFLAQSFNQEKIVLDASYLTFCLTILKNPEQNVQKLKDTIRFSNSYDQADVKKVIVSDNIDLFQLFFEKIKPNGDNDTLGEINFEDEFNLKELSLGTSDTDRKPIKTAEELYQDYLSGMNSVQKSYFNNGTIEEKKFQYFHWIIPNKDTDLEIQNKFVQTVFNEENVENMVRFLQGNNQKESKDSLSLILDKLSKKNQKILITALQTKYQELFNSFLTIQYDGKSKKWLILDTLQEDLPVNRFEQEKVVPVELDAKKDDKKKPEDHPKNISNKEDTKAQMGRQSDMKSKTPSPSSDDSPSNPILSLFKAIGNGFEWLVNLILSSIREVWS